MASQADARMLILQEEPTALEDEKVYQDKPLRKAMMARSYSETTKNAGACREEQGAAESDLTTRG